MDATQDDASARGGEFAEVPPENTPEEPAEERGGSGWVTTDVAAAALGVTARTVREYIRSERLRAKAEGQGVNKTWLVSIDDVQGLRESRRNSAETPRNLRGVSRGPATAEGSPVDAAETIRELITRLEARTAEAADVKARLELTAHAESTLREALERERERADRAEEELRELRRRLDASSAPRDGSETVTEASGKGDVPPASQEGSERSWWRRVFGG